MIKTYSVLFFVFISASCASSPEQVIRSGEQLSDESIDLDVQREERFVTVTNLDTGVSHERRVGPGRILLFEKAGVSQVRFPVVWTGEEEIRYRIIEENTLEINGQIVGLVLDNSPSAVSQDLIERHRGRLRSIIINNVSEIDQSVAQALVEISSEHLSLTLHLESDGDPRLCRLCGFVGERLESLTLRGQNISDASIVDVEQFQNLRWLDLDVNRISNSGVARLSDLIDLEVLICRSLNRGSEPFEDTIVGSGFTDAALAHFSDLTELRVLDICGTGVTNAGLVHLSELSNLERLHFRSTGITDAGLVHLSNFPELRSLRLPLGVTDAGLVHLRDLRRLEELDLEGSGVTEAGLARLADLENLKTLILPFRITDAGLAHLSGITSLEFLFIESARRITDAGLAHLSGLTNLKWLDLSFSQIGNDALVHLSELSNLRYLNIGFTRVTDAGLSHLSGLPSLRYVDVYGTEISFPALRAFREAHPNVEITEPRGPHPYRRRRQR